MLFENRSSKLLHWQIALIFALILSLESGHCSPVASKLKAGPAYLPPLEEPVLTSKNLPQSSLVNHNFRSPNSFRTSYTTNHGIDSKSKLKSESTYSRTYHNSYSPQPSGIGVNNFIPPTLPPLPPLIPNTVLKQLSSTSSVTSPSSSRSLALDSSTLRYNTAIFPNVVMVDNSMEVVTPSQKETIFAAKLLASSLLREASASSSVNHDQSNDVGPDDVSSKDMFIVKAQKNAYIVPNDLSEMEIQELYNMRDKLDKAYTVNQFIFIVRPENINFLNKLV